MKIARDFLVLLSGITCLLVNPPPLTSTDLSPRSATIRQRIKDSLGELSSHYLERRGDHFLVYAASSDQDFAREVLNAAERYYHRIAELVGYPRYDSFWTWENRCIIVVFPTMETFRAATGQAGWVEGFALPDLRVIVGQREVPDFLEAVLPHEIAHCILHDYLGDAGAVPDWLDEGIAILAQEKTTHKVWKPDQLPDLDTLEQGALFMALTRWSYRNETDADKIAFFYRMSYTLVQLLLDRFGQERFQEFCKTLKETRMDQDEALKKVYGRFGVDSFAALESIWHEGG